MEILFENSYVRTKELAKEIYRYYNFRRPFVVTIDIIFLLSFISNAVTLILYGYYNLTAFVFIPLFFVFQVYVYFKQVNTMCKRDVEVHGKEIAVTTIVTEEYIENTASTGAVNRLEYCNVRSAVQTKNLILLRSRANLIYIFRKDTFTKNNKDAFIDFLSTKGIKIR